MKKASIDIGTNTVRLLIAEVVSGTIETIHIERRITRLGGGYVEEVGMSSEAMDRTIDALKDFRTIIDSFEVSEVICTATSVVRRSINKDKFISMAKSMAGITVNVIDGVKEAMLSSQGVLSVLDDVSSSTLVMDIGGGSTEFIFIDNDELKGQWSLEFGVVHITETYLKSAPAKDSEIENATAYIRKNLNKLVNLIDDDFYGERQRFKVLVGTAGTVTTLGAIDLDMEFYEADKINNHKMTIEKVREIYSHLASLNITDRIKILSLEKGREDLIIAGALIVLEVMDNFQFEELIISDAGLLEGILLNQ